MEQDIIELNNSYSDNVSTQVITIDLPHPPSVPNNQTDVQTIIYPQDGHTMTPLEPNDSTTHQVNNDQLETTATKNSHYESINSNNNTTDNNNDNFVSIVLVPDRSMDNVAESDENNTSNGSKSIKRFKWTKEKSQVAMNLVKHGCKPKLVSVAVGCSLRTAQKFVETVTPKMEGESYKDYEIRRRGRKSKDVNQRLNAIREVLSKDTTKTQVEIAADLKVSNTTVCRDLKRIGASWKVKKSLDQSGGNKRETKKERQTTTKKLSSTTPKGNRGRQKKQSTKKEPIETSETNKNDTSSVA